MNRRIQGGHAYIYSGSNLAALMMGLEGITVSNGSACTAASVDPSHVLTAMGLSETEAFSCLRFSLGRFSQAAELPATWAAA